MNGLVGMTPLCVIVSAWACMFGSSPELCGEELTLVACLVGVAALSAKPVCLPEWC